MFFTALFGALSNELGLVSSAGLVGLAVAYALNITETLNFAVRQIRYGNNFRVLYGFYQRLKLSTSSFI